MVDITKKNRYNGKAKKLKTGGQNMTKQQERELRVREDLYYMGISSIGIYTKQDKVFVAVHAEKEETAQNGKEYLKAVNQNLILL